MIAPFYKSYYFQMYFSTIFREAVAEVTAEVATEKAIAVKAMDVNVTVEMFPTTKSTNQNFFSVNLKYLTQPIASVVTFVILQLDN